MYIFTNLLLNVNNQVLHDECHVVATMKAMPDGQKYQSGTIANVTIVEELQTLEDVLGDPLICVDIETVHIVLHGVTRLQKL